MLQENLQNFGAISALYPIHNEENDSIAYMR